MKNFMCNWIAHHYENQTRQTTASYTSTYNINFENLQYQMLDRINLRPGELIKNFNK